MLQNETQGSLPDFNLDLQHLGPQNQSLLLQIETFKIRRKVCLDL